MPMSDTQILVLTVTFLLAAVVVLPLTYLAYRKEKRRHEITLQRERAHRAREARLRRQEEEIQKRQKEDQVRNRKVAEYDARRPHFKELRDRLYVSPTCTKCASHLVHIVSLSAETGVLPCRCNKCGTVRRVYANSKDAFLREGGELAAILRIYHALEQHYPNYPGLAVSFPEPTAGT